MKELRYFLVVLVLPFAWCIGCKAAEPGPKAPIGFQDQSSRTPTATASGVTARYGNSEPAANSGGYGNAP